MLTNAMKCGYGVVKRLKPLAYTYKPALDWFLFMPFLRRECANILNKHTRLYAAVSNSRHLGLLGVFEQKAYKMKNQISVYNFNQNKIRTTTVDGEPFFNLNDCCEALGIVRGYKSTVRLSPEGVRETSLLTPGGLQVSKFINEPNLYRLIFRSNKPQAQAFADWVYSEVLPSIRKTGAYGVPALVDKRLENTIRDCVSASVRDALKITDKPFDFNVWHDIIVAALNLRTEQLFKEYKRRMLDALEKL